MLQFSFWDILSNLLIATQWTIVLSLIAFACGGIVGLALLFMRTSRIPALEWFTKIYIEFFQGTPLLMQLFLFFFGIALFGRDRRRNRRHGREQPAVGSRLEIRLDVVFFARAAMDRCQLMAHGLQHPGIDQLPWRQRIDFLVFGFFWLALLLRLLGFDLEVVG